MPKAKEKSIRVIVGSIARGGTERHLSYIYPQLVKKGWSVRLLTITPQDDLLETFLEGGVSVHMPPPWTHHRWLESALFRPFKLVIAFFRFLSDFLTDRHSITHFFLPRTYALGMLVALLSGLKAPKLMSRRSLNIYQKKYPGFKTLEKHLHTHCDSILGNSQAVIHQLHQQEDVPHDKLKLIYNGIPLKTIDKTTSNREQLGLGKNTLVMTIVANLIPYKGHQDLLEALTLIKEDLPKDWTLLCVGQDSGIQDKLKKYAQTHDLAPHIQWLGSRSDIYTLLKSSDMGLLCSHQEGFSNAILEGMACALPLVVTDVGGNGEAVLHNQTGLVVPAQDPVALSKAILKLAQDEPLRKTMGTAGRKRVEAHFSLEKCVQTYHDLYETFL